MTKTKNKNEYFTKIHEEAIILYCNTNLKSEKTKLYSELIQPAFNELVDKIVFTYKFNNLPNIDVLKDDCKVWLTTILDKYCLLYTSPSPRDKRQSRMPSSA